MWQEKHSDIVIQVPLGSISGKQVVVPADMLTRMYALQAHVAAHLLVCLSVVLAVRRTWPRLETMSETRMSHMPTTAYGPVLMYVSRF